MSYTRRHPAGSRDFNIEAILAALGLTMAEMESIIVQANAEIAAEREADRRMGIGR